MTPSVEDAIEPLLRFHETGGHEGDGSDERIALIRTLLSTLERPAAHKQQVVTPDVDWSKGERGKFFRPSEEALARIGEAAENAVLSESTWEEIGEAAVEAIRALPPIAREEKRDE